MSGLFRGYFSNLYEYRYMFVTLVKRNLVGRYRSSKLGFLWNYLTPLITIVLFYVVFDNIIGKDIPNYWVYICVGVFPYTFLLNSLMFGSVNISSNADLVNKVRFPTELLTYAQCTYLFIVFLMEYIVAIPIIYLLGHLVSPVLYMLPLLFILALFFSFGIVSLLSALNVYFRDIEHIINAFSRLIFWFSPVVYQLDMIDPMLANLICLNPLTPYIRAFQDIVYYGVIPSFDIIASCMFLSVVVFIVGVVVFNRLKGGFAERV